MKTPKYLSTIAAGLVLCLTSITVRAQEATAGTKLADVLESRVTCRFDEAPLKEACEYLTEQFFALNVVVDPSLNEEAVSLNVTQQKLESVFALFDQMIGCRSMVYSSNFGWVPISDAHNQGFSGDGEPIVVYIKAGNPERTESTQVYFVGSLLSEKMTIEDVAAALEMSWSMQADASQPQMKFHEETGMLIAKATPELLEVADQVIAQLPGGAEVLQRALAARVSRHPDQRMTALSQLSEVKTKQIEESYLRKLHELETSLAREQQNSFEFRTRMNESKADSQASTKEAEEMRARALEAEAKLRELKQTRK